MEWSNLRMCVRSQVQSFSESGDSLHLSLLWRNFWLGFTYSININNSIFIAMTNSQVSFVPLINDCKVFMTQQIEPHVQKSSHWNSCLWLCLSEWNVCVPVCVWVHKCMSTLVCMWLCGCMWIRCASVLEGLMKSSPKVRCHAVSTAVVQEQSLTSESPPWKPSRKPKEEDKGQPKREYC